MPNPHPDENVKLLVEALRYAEKIFARLCDEDYTEFAFLDMDKIPQALARFAAASTVKMQGDYVKTRNILSWTICNEKGRYLMSRKTLSTGEILETWTHLADPAMRFGDEQSAKDFCLPGQTIAKWVSREVL